MDKPLPGCVTVAFTGRFCDRLLKIWAAIQQMGES